MDYNELRKKASELGIKTHGKKRDEIEELVNGGAPALTEEVKQEAKQARTGRRARRGGALLGKGEYKLNRPELLRKGFKRHWFKDEPGRLSAAEANDWDYVKENGKQKTLRNGTNQNGTLRTMYLMEKHEDWNRADQLKKREQDRKNEQLLRDGKEIGNSAGMAQAQTQWSEAAAKAEEKAGEPIVSLGGAPTYAPTGGIQVNTLIKQ